jgi:hypothetical protein
VIGGENMPLRLDGAEYKVDLDLLDRYQGFSSEILKLSLAGVAVFGVLAKATWLNLDDSFVFIAVAIVLFGLSAAFSLGHRFLSNEGMFYHIRSLRKRSDDDADAVKRNEYFSRSEFCMKAGAILLCSAALCLAVGLGKGIVFGG